jgi:beta-N-acetylhexosaminidase
MSVEASLRTFPFNLSEDDINWVRKTRDGLSTARKVRQLFVQIAFPHQLDELIAAEPAGFMPVPAGGLAGEWTTNHRFLTESEVPPFICQDLEGGGNHRSSMTDMPNQLAFAACTDLKATEAALHVMALEASALGYNFSFTPCIDINQDFRSAIVGTRSYGSDLGLIAQHSEQHIAVLRSHGIACSAKHWPGEGLDARDQHLVTTINPQTYDEWQTTFGMLYRKLISSGILSVMSAHIAFPAYAAKHGIPESLARYTPASMSKLLNNNLLREELGFNGLIVSDATPMAGLTSHVARAEQVPGVIEAGCDIFLFSTNVAHDIQHMENGLRTGLLSEQRLEDAVTRILGMKAALGLHKKSVADRLKSQSELAELFNSPKHLSAAQDVANKSVTLVKDVRNTLPLNARKHKRITWIGQPAPGFLPGMPATPMSELRQALVDEGFMVSDFNGNNPPDAENTDLVLYVLPTESSLGKSRIYIDWMREHPGQMELMSRYWHDLSTVMVSLGHPYHLYDAPRVPCYINAYSNVPPSQRAVANCLVGKAEFLGVSPVDAFAEVPDAKY